MGKILEVLGRRPGGSLALLVLVLVVFGSAVSNRFTLDSKRFLPDDPRIRDFQAGAILTTDYWNHAPDAAMAQAEADLYRPMTLLWLAFLQALTPESQLAENRSVIVNLGNVLLHALSVVLRFLLFHRLLAGRPHGGRIAFLAAAVLAVHPIVTEAACTQVGASESLAAVFATGSLLAFLAWRRGGGWSRAAISGALLLLGLLSKENAVVAAAAAPLLAWLVLREPLAKAALAAVPAALAVLAWAAIRFALFGAVLGVGDPVYAGFPADARLATALAAVGAYDVPALFWPAKLLPVVSFQDLPPATGLADLRALAGAAFLLVVLAWAGLHARRDPPAAFGLLFFLVAFLPVSNLLTGIGAVAATRFLYLPLTGLALALACGAADLLRSPRAGPRRAGAAFAALLVLVPLGFGWREAPVWKDEVALYGAAFERSPTTFSAFNLGVALQERAAALGPKPDSPVAAGLLREARARFEKAAQMPRPVIPGTDIVPEDLLDVAFQACMNAGFAHLTFAPPDPVRARAFFLMAGDVAGTGVAQTGQLRATTVWTTLQSDVETALATLSFQEAAREREPAVRERRIADAEAALARARSFWPGNWRAELVALEAYRLRNDPAGLARALEALHVRSRPQIATDSRAADVAMALGDHLLKKGERARGLKIMLEAALAGPDRVTGDEPFFNFGREAIGLDDPALRKLGRESLAIFLERSRRRPEALAKQRAEARRLLDGLPR